MNVEISSPVALSRDRRRFYAPFNSVAVERVQVKWYVRYAYYGFIFSLPFEMADVSVGGLLALSKLLGYMLVAAAVFQKSICFKPPARALWFFGIYVAILAVSGLTVAFSEPGNGELHRTLLIRYFSRAQMLAMAWISYNVLRQENVVKGTLLCLYASTIILVLLQLAGLAGETVSVGDRATAFDANPNSVATVIALGIMAGFGLAYGREQSSWKERLLFWSTAALLALSLVKTGSRGALVALVLALGFMWLKKGDIAIKFKMIFLGLIGCIFLAVASYQIPVVRARWEKTLLEGKIAGRDHIYANAVQMFLEKPLFGWGFVNNFYELGMREGVRTRDPHNVYLWLLTEVGLIGTIPFLVGLWMCWRSAWKARFNIQGVLPLMMITFLLVSGLKGSWQNNKLFWFVIAYTLASGTYSAVKKRRQNSSLTGAFRQRKIVQVPARSRAVPSGFRYHSV